MYAYLLYLEKLPTDYSTVYIKTKRELRKLRYEYMNEILFFLSPKCTLSKTPNPTASRIDNTGNHLKTELFER